MLKRLCWAQLGFLCTFASFSAMASFDGSIATESVASEIEIMSYNVENLFDTQHDEGKDDWEYLPSTAAGKTEHCQTIKEEKYQKSCLATEWNESRLEMKYQQIKKAILGDGQKLPQILGLIEVENENVVEGLRTTLGYDHFVMTNSPDKRGIDVAILYNDHPSIHYLRHFEHVMEGPTFSDKPTRNILEVHFDVGGGRTLAIFQNHWPSQAAPGEVRTIVAKQVATLVDQFIAGKGKAQRSVILMGDFNTLPTDIPHPFHQGLLLAQTKLQDIHETFMNSKFITNEVKMKVPRGTYFYSYDMGWNLLDRFFVTPDLLDGKGVELLLHTYKINNSKSVLGTYEYKNPQDPNFGTKIEGMPKRYDHSTDDPAKAGFSDHFGIVIKLSLGTN